ncbi:MAG: hypothetical protein GC190_10140 [Alphaproteobacteria bacterium]|nr:hypothetical protein [Alphaproteobacteria bacterium]
MSGPVTSVSDSDKKLASQFILGAAIVMGVMGLIAVLLGGFVWAVVDWGVAGALGYFGYMKMSSGDLNTVKLVSLICAGIILLLGLLALTNATAGGGLGFLIAIVVIGAGCGLVYAAMLISPGRKLF